MLYATMLRKKTGAPFTGNAIILVKGPSTIDIRDMQIGWDGEKDHPAGILVENADQPEPRPISISYTPMRIPRCRS